jgi:arylsulfatase
MDSDGPENRTEFQGPADRGAALAGVRARGAGARAASGVIAEGLEGLQDSGVGRNWRAHRTVRCSEDGKGKKPMTIVQEQPRGERPQEGGKLKAFLLRTLGLIGMLASVTAPTAASAAEPDRRPNVVVILADDMGFADMGSFGSEIRTPNLDSLANDGVRFNNFYTHATCSPSRAMFLTGVDSHQAGLGNMDEWIAPNQVGVPGYEGYLRTDIATLPELLRQSGYHTYMVGKWHMGKQPDQIPAARGFERDFSMLDGAGSYWDMTNFTAASPRSVFTEDGKYLTALPKDYYATKTYTDKMIEFINSNRGSGKPFFAYVAHQAPHDPYHLPREWRNRHVGEYDKGWDVVRQERLARQVKMGIMPEGTELSERMWFGPNPIVLAPASRAIAGKRMELYAGLVENLDSHVGRLIAHLKKIGEYDNTIFIVFGDNGAEGSDLFELIAGNPGSRDSLFAAIAWSQTHHNAWGDPGTYVAYGPLWAQASMTPFSQYKGFVAEGGIRNALIVSGPVVKRPKGSINGGLMSIADIMPTLLDIAGASYPTEASGKPAPPLIGKSWKPVLAGEAETPRTEKDYLVWELFGNRALRQGDWKIRWQIKPMGKSDWELFNVTADPAERTDLAAQHPERVQAMVALWDEYAKRHNIIIPNRGPYETMESQLPDRVPDDPGFPPLIYRQQFVPPKDMVAPPR